MWPSNGWMALVAIWTILAIVLGQQGILRNSSQYLESQDILTTRNINLVQKKSSTDDINGEVVIASRAASENVKFRKMDSVKNNAVDLKLKTKGSDSQKFALETPKKDSYSLANIRQGFGMVVNPVEFARKKNSSWKDSSDFKNFSVNEDGNVFEIDSNKTIAEEEGDFIVIGKDENFRKIQRRSSYVLSRQKTYENLGEVIIKSKQHPRYGSNENRVSDIENRDFNDATSKYQNNLTRTIKFGKFFKISPNQTRVNDKRTAPVNEKIHSSQQLDVKFFEKSKNQISSKSIEKAVNSSVKDIESMQKTKNHKQRLDKGINKDIEFDRAKNVKSSKDYQINVSSKIKSTSSPEKYIIPASSPSGNTKSSQATLSVRGTKNSIASDIPVDPKIQIDTVHLKSRLTMTDKVVQEMENFRSVAEQGSRNGDTLQSARIDYDKLIAADATTRPSNESPVDENNAKIPSTSERKINIETDRQEKSHVGKGIENNSASQQVIYSYGGTVGNVSKNDSMTVEQKEINVSREINATGSHANFRKSLLKLNLIDKNGITKKGEIPSKFNLINNLDQQNIESSEIYHIAGMKVIQKDRRTLGIVKPYEGNWYLDSGSNRRNPRNKRITNARIKSDTGNAFSSVNPYGESALVENPLFERSPSWKKYPSETTWPDKVVSNDKDVLSVGNVKASTRINVANETFLAKMSSTSIFRKIQSVSNVAGEKSDNRQLRGTTWTDYSHKIGTTKYSSKDMKLINRSRDGKGLIFWIKKSINDTDNVGEFKAFNEKSEESIHRRKELMDIATSGGNNNSENHSNFSLKSPNPPASNTTMISLLFPRNILAKKYQLLGTSMRRSNEPNQSVSIRSMKTSEIEKNFVNGTGKFNEHGTWSGFGPGTIIQDRRSHELNSKDAISATANSKENENTLLIGHMLHEIPVMWKAHVDDGIIKANQENNYTGTNSTRIPLSNKLDEPYGNPQIISSWLDKNQSSIRSKDQNKFLEENVISSLIKVNDESPLARKTALNFLMRNETYLPNNNNRILINETSEKDKEIKFNTNIYLKSSGKTLHDDDIYDKKKIRNSRTPFPNHQKSTMEYTIRTMEDRKDPFVERNESFDDTGIKEPKKADTERQTRSKQSLGHYYNINKSRLFNIDSRNEEIGADGPLIKQTTRKLAIHSDSPGEEIDENIILRKLSSDSVFTTPINSAFTEISKKSMKDDVFEKSKNTLISLEKSIDEDNWLRKLMNDEGTSEFEGLNSSPNVSIDVLSTNLENFNRNNRNFPSLRKRDSLDSHEIYENLDNGKKLDTQNTKIPSVKESNDKRNYDFNTLHETSMLSNIKEIYDAMNDTNLKKLAIKNMTNLIKNENLTSSIYGGTDSSYTTESLNTFKMDSTTINILETSVDILTSNKDASLRSSDQELYDSLASNQSLSTYDQIESDNTTRASSTLNQWPVKHSAVVEGDLVLGGLMMVHEREDSVTCGPVMPQGGIQALEAMLYTLDRLNEKGIVPGVKIGAHILDDCDKDTYGLEMAVDFIKGCRGTGWIRR